MLVAIPFQVLPALDTRSESREVKIMVTEGGFRFCTGAAGVRLFRGLGDLASSASVLPAWLEFQVLPSSDVMAFLVRVESRFDSR
jgi:hypothetical protein